MTTADANMERLASELLERAAEIERLEQEIRQELLRLAHQGRAEDITRLVTRWCEGPVETVLAKTGEEGPSKGHRNPHDQPHDPPHGPHTARTRLGRPQGPQSG